MYDLIPNDFQVFTDYISNISGKYDSLCYSNALETYQELGLPLYVGLVFDEDVIKRLQSDDPKYINFSHHAWNLKNGKVYDCTLGSNNDTYVGKHVPNRIADNLQNGSDVREILFQYLNK